MSLRDQLRSYRAILPRLRDSATREQLKEQIGWLRRRPQLFAGIIAYEAALATSAKVDARLKALAELKAAALVNCEFCLDMGSSLARLAGVSDAQLEALPHYRHSDLFDADEKLALELAEHLSSTPVIVDDQLRQRLVQRFSPAGVAELAAAIAWENFRGRFNQALGVRPAGFSAGAICAVPERPAP